MGHRLCDTEVLKIGAGNASALNRSAVYSYLHVSGGIATPAIFDSRSTSVRRASVVLPALTCEMEINCPSGRQRRDHVKRKPPLTESAPTLAARFVPKLSIRAALRASYELVAGE